MSLTAVHLDVARAAYALSHFMVVTEVRRKCGTYSSQISFTSCLRSYDLRKDPHCPLRFCLRILPADPFIKPRQYVSIDVFQTITHSTKGNSSSSHLAWHTPACTVAGVWSIAALWILNRMRLGADCKKVPPKRRCIFKTSCARSSASPPSSNTLPYCQILLGIACHL
jgi:hypothetical protein